MTVASVEKFREAWIKSGKKWFDLNAMPKEWSWEQQKTLIPDLFR